MKNCYFTSRDRVFDLYDKNEVIELFGQDYLEEYGYSIPEELLIEFKETSKKLNELTEKIKRIIK